MFDAAMQRERRNARTVALLINHVARPMKRAATVDDVMGIKPPEKKHRWRTAAQVKQEDDARARRAEEKANAGQ